MTGRPPLPASEVNVFATLRGSGRVWAVGAVHGEARRLRTVLGHMDPQIKPGDQIVFLGGYLGWAPQVRETIDELLVFRRTLIARPGIEVDDIIFLRGAQEEMWQKLLQLQFAGNAAEVLQWLADHGIGPTLHAYGSSVAEGLSAAADGVLALTRWTGALRHAMRQVDGHTSLLSALKHAAMTDDGTQLFVHGGIDPSRPLSAQLDHFWWGSKAFDQLQVPWEGYRLIVRGHDRRQGGLVMGRPVVTLDAGCGRGGTLIAACFAGDGEILQMLEG